jgi:serine/threonine protein kinase/Tfp pilus assembly protein PilF
MSIDTPPPRTDGSQAETAVRQLDALLDDQSRRWCQGERFLVESYLENHPSFRADECLLDLIYHEVLLRGRQGESPRLDEYQQRFPHLAEELGLQFEVHRLIGPAATSAVLSVTGESDRNERRLPRVTGYEVMAVVGQGGMGVVYRARQSGLNRLVALKMIRGGAALARPLDLARFRAEAEVLARLEHPNIVRIYEVGEHEGNPYFAMELVEGANLAQLVAGAPLPPLQAARLAETLAIAVEAAHARGVVHRDLKPANILIGRQTTSNDTSETTQFALDRVKITDFGLAKQMDTQALQTRSGEIIGTPSYMAPEQACGRAGEVGPATDVYALGALFYEMLTGRPPFRAATLWDTLDQVLSQDPVPPRQLLAKLPADLEVICLKCLRKEPGKRYARAADLAEDLRRFRAGEPILARPSSCGEQAWKWVKRHPSLAVSGLTAVLVLLVLSLGHYLHLRTALAHALAGQELQAAVAEVQAQLYRVERAVEEDDWPRARDLLGSVPSKLEPAHAKFPDDAALAELRSSADRLRLQTDSHLTDRARWNNLQQRRAAASLLAAGFTGVDAESNLRSTRTQVTEALSLFGLRADQPGPPDLAGTSYTPAVRAAIAECFCEMLLDLADVLTDTARRQEAAAKRPLVEEALRLLDGAAAYPVAAAVLQGRRARCLGELGDQAGAAHEREGLRPAFTRAFEMFLHGTFLYREGRQDEASEHFQQALKQEPDHMGAQYALAVCYLKHRTPQGRPTRLPLAVYRLTRCIDLQPQQVWPYLLRGYAHGELDDFEAAEADFAHVERIVPEQPDPLARYGMHVNRGLMRVRQGKLPAAVEDLTQAIRLKPGEYPAYANLAQAYQELGQWQQAQEHLDRALDLSPTALRAVLYRTRARLHEHQNRPESALRDYDEAIRHEPRGLASAAVAGDLVAKAGLLVRQQDYAEALRTLDAALALQPEQAAVQRLRAESLLQLDRLPEAVQALDRALEPEPAKRKTTAALYLARGRARSALGRFAEAVGDYTCALELLSDHADALTNRGWGYTVLEAPALALRDFERVVQLDPRSADGHNGRGFARVRLGQYRLAVADAESALKLATAPQGRLLYNSARIYAQALQKNEEDPAQQTVKGRELRVQYLERAVELLRQALESLNASERPTFWRRTVQSDPALTPIRRSPGYLRLAAAHSEAAP